MAQPQTWPGSATSAAGYGALFKSRPPLDGVGAGIFGALPPLANPPPSCAGRRHNLAGGAIATMVGIGASLRGLAIGEVVEHLDYSPAF